ncbi:MAG: serine/threonine protein kinase [Planctomycetes bacterium]|nr:serine/threonine protein kinase [Planctomycetota bacterium]
MTLLAGRYEVLGEIARGGMGRVVRARDRVLDREVAIKLLLGRARGLLQARFLEESQVTGQLAHPNIVPVHDLGLSDDEPFLVMKLVQGRTLREVTKALKAGDRRARLEFERPRLVRLFLKVCEAVGYAHGRGVIHRDLKPSNIMVARGDEVLVMDWGLAKPYRDADGDHPDLIRSQVRTFRGADLSGSLAGSLDLSGSRVGGPGDTVAERSHDGQTQGDTSQLTAEGDIVGTPAYMPPEQVDDASRLDPRADVYSLGACLYELLTLRPPYEGGGMEVVTTLVREAPPTPRAAAPDEEIPPALEAIVLKAMSRDPKGRYPDAGALAAEVARWLDGQAVGAYQESTREALGRLLRRHKGLVATIAASVVVAQAALVGAAALVRAERRQVELESADARAAATQADDGRRAAEVEGQRAKLLARAAALTGRCVLVASELDRRARDLVPLEPGDAAAGAQEVTLAELRRQARAELVATRAELERLGAADDLGPFLAEVEAALRGVDAAYLDALLARSPRRALALLAEEGLSLTPGARALGLARAHHRLGAFPAALAALSAVDAEELGAAGAALKDLLGHGALDQVEARFTAAIRAEPDRAWLYLRRAEARARQGKFDEANVDYDRAARLQRIDAWIYSSRVRYTYPLVSYHGETKLLENTLKLVGELAPDNREAEDLAARGHLWGRGDWDGYRKSIAALAGDDVVRRARLEAEGALVVQRWQEAAAAAEEVLTLTADDPVALGCLAEARLELGQVDEAARAARRALALAPDEPRAATALGRVLARRGGRELDEGLRLLEAGARGALSSDPWRHLAEALLRSDSPQRWEDGVQAARRGLALDPYALLYYHPSARPIAGDPRLHRVIARLRVKQGRHGAAIAHHMRAFVMGQARAHQALGTDLVDALEAGDLHERLGLLNEALSLWSMAKNDPALAEQAEARSRRLLERHGGGR